MENIILGVCFFVFLFTLYVLSRDDFVLLRKNVSMDFIFNVSFFCLFIALLSGRVLFVLQHFSTQYLNPLVFFGIPYYPGISIMGAVLGFIVFLLYYTSYRKVPKERMLDFFTVSLCVALAVGYTLHLLSLFLQNQKLPIFSYIMPFLLVSASVVFLTVLLPRYRRGEMKDAHLAYVFLVVFSAATLVTDVISKNAKLLSFSVVSLEGIIAAIIFLFSLALLLKKEKRVIKFTKIRL